MFHNLGFGFEVMEGINEMVVGEEQVGLVIICKLWIEFALENGGKRSS